MALTFFWNCEAEDFSSDNAYDSPYTGSCYSAGDDIAAANGAVSLDAAAAKQGSTGILINGVSERYSFDPASIIATSGGCVGMWIRSPTSLLNTGALYFYCRGTSANDCVLFESAAGGAQVLFRLRNDTGGQADLSTGSGTVDASMVADAWYFIVARWNISTDYRRIEVYNSSLTLIQHHTDTSTDLAAYEPTDFIAGGLRFGDVSGWGATRVGHYDNIFIASNYDEAIQDYADITSYTEYGASGSVVGSVMGGKLIGRGVLTGGSLI